MAPHLLLVKPPSRKSNLVRLVSGGIACIRCHLRVETKKHDPEFQGRPQVIALKGEFNSSGILLSTGRRIEKWMISKS